ncbi:hypothetical protein ES703_32499 [subsurface metagenome]
MFGQEDGGQKPARSHSHSGDVVGIDVDGVPANEVSGESYRVCFGDQQFVIEFDYGDIFTNSGAEHHPLIFYLELTEESFK